MTKARSSADFAAGGPQVAGKNGVINGGMDIWQRGTSIAVSASTNPYTCDRWKLSLGSGSSYTVSRQATGDTTNLPFIQYAARVQRDSGQTGVNIPYFIQGIETVNSIPYAGKTVTVSFYARSNIANKKLAYENITIRTISDAEKALKEDLKSREFIVLQNIKIPLTLNQFSALVSYVYNTGGSATLYRLINNRSSDKEIRTWFETKYISANGKRLAGLVRRRKAEANLYFKK